MRLLSTSDPLVIRDFYNDAPDYAILSHTWMADEDEVSFNTVLEADERPKRGWEKVSNARQIAAQHGLRWIWIDTCCIDKTSSAELSEAINSMYRWYKDSTLCLVYLADLSAIAEPIATRLGSCRWFTRGWTLQEMLAPRPTQVHFYDSAWQSLGSLQSLADIISSITTIDVDLLKPARPRSLSYYSTAQKLSWAAHRRTRRTEDTAYCLLGLFGVNMPIIYGEGKEAFFRLQEAILRAEPSDQTIFAWERTQPKSSDFSSLKSWSQLLAPSPAHFARLGDMTTTEAFPGFSYRGDDHEVISSGVRIRLPIYRLGKHDPERIAVLRCQVPTLAGTVFALKFSPHRNTVTDVVKFNGYHIAGQTPSFDNGVLLFARASQPDKHLLPYSSYNDSAPEDIPSLDVHSIMVEAKPTLYNPPWANKVFGVFKHHGDEQRSMLLHYDKQKGRSRCEGEVELVSLDNYSSESGYERNILAKIKFAVSIEHSEDREAEFSRLQAATKIVRRADGEQPTSELLNSPWASSTVFEYKYPFGGDSVSSYTLARSIRRIDNKKLLLVRMVPATLFGRMHLILEVQIIDSISAHLLFNVVLPWLQQLRRRAMQMGTSVFMLVVAMYIINKELDVLGLIHNLEPKRRIGLLGIINMCLMHMYAGPKIVAYRVLWPWASACLPDFFASPLLYGLAEIITMFTTGFRQYWTTQKQFLKDRFNYSRDLFGILDSSVLLLVVVALHQLRPYFISFVLCMLDYLVSSNQSPNNSNEPT